MYGIIPLEAYVANYDAILESKPFKYGNMKGKILNKSKFFKDHSDYEVLLRKEIPDKYTQYFNTPKDEQQPVELDDNIFNSKVEINDDEDDKYFDVEIEYPRSNNLNLSPIKSPMEKGVKDSEVLGKKFQGIELEDDTFHYLKSRNNTENIMSAGYSLNLGNLSNFNENKRMPSKSKIQNKTIQKENTNDVSDVQFEDLDDLYEQTFRKLNKSSLMNDDGKQLNLMIMKIMDNLKESKAENVKLRNNVNDMNMIIKDLNKLATVYKTKLKSYYLENKNLKGKVQSLLYEQASKPYVSKTEAVMKNNYMEKNDVKSSVDETGKVHSSNETDEIDEIDKQIKRLQIQKLQKKNELAQINHISPTADVSALSDEIVKKLMIQLKQHTNENHQVDKHANLHGDCPFCETKPNKENILSGLFGDVNLQSNENMIDLIAERLKSKMMQVDDVNDLPEIW